MGAGDDALQKVKSNQVSAVQLEQRVGRDPQGAEKAMGARVLFGKNGSNNREVNKLGCENGLVIGFDIFFRFFIEEYIETNACFAMGSAIRSFVASRLILNTRLCRPGGYKVDEQDGNNKTHAANVRNKCGNIPEELTGNLRKIFVLTGVRQTPTVSSAH